MQHEKNIRVVDIQLVGGEGKVLNGKYIRVVNGQLVGGEGIMLHGQYIRSGDRELFFEKVEVSIGRLLELWIESLLVERAKC